MPSGTLGRRAALKSTLVLLLACLALKPAQAACTLSFTNLAFGTYTGTLLTGTSQATVNCPSGTSYSIALNAGTGSGATTTTRKMTGSSGTLSYQIFQNSSRTTNWGNTSGSDEVTGTGTGSNQTINAYAQILGSQYGVPGTYTDTVSSATGSFSVTATIQATCNISASAVAFGTYAGAVVTASANLSVQCTNSTTYTIGLSAGTTSGATVTNRLLTGPSGRTLAYAIFSDSGHTVNWGSTSNTLSGTGTGAVQTVPVYGRISASQYVTPGSYTDTITATITY